VSEGIRRMKQFIKTEVIRSVVHVLSPYDR
jgi:hypothetical protein